MSVRIVRYWYNNDVIITLTGPNNFAIKQALGLLTRQFVAAHGADSVERMEGDSCSPQDLPDLLQGATLFATDRLIIMRGAAQNKPLWEALHDWLDRVSTETTLVLIEPMLDKRTKTYKALKKLSDFKEFNELSERDLLVWLQKTAEHLGNKLDAKAAQYLLQKVGLDQWQLWQELQKLVNYSSPITAEAVDALIEPHVQASVFDLLDSTLGRKPDRMRELLSKLRTTEDVYKLFGLLVSQVHTLALVVSAGNKNAETIASEAGVHPFVVRKTQALARTLGQSELGHIIATVARLDMQLKSTGADPWILLEQCLSKIATR